MNIGDIAMIKMEDKKPSTWNIGLKEVPLEQTSTGYWDQPIQLPWE